MLAGRPGDLFVPVIRSSLPDGDARISAPSTGPIYWSTKCRAQLNCRIFTGLRHPLSAGAAWTQRLAIAVRPTGGETTLRLATGRRTAPLRGSTFSLTVPFAEPRCSDKPIARAA